jgi:hypothetical protein
VEGGSSLSEPCSFHLKSVIRNNANTYIGESAELPPGGGAIILAKLRFEGGQVKSFSRLLLILSRGGAIILAKLRFFWGG